MAAYTTRMRPDFSSGGIKVPDLESTLLGFSDRMATQQAAEEAKKRQERLDKIAADERAEATRRWNITNDRAAAQAARMQDEYDRKVKKETATNEAMQAILNPEYGKEAVVDAENAFKTGLANLTPEEQKIAIAEFEPAKKNVRDYMVSEALGAEGVDQSKVFNLQELVNSKRAKTPGTEEYETLKKERLKLLEEELRLKNKYRPKTGSGNNVALMRFMKNMTEDKAIIEDATSKGYKGTSVTGAKDWLKNWNGGGSKFSFKSELYNSLSGKDSGDVEAIDKFLTSNWDKIKDMNTTEQKALTAKLKAKYAGESGWDISDFLGGSAAGDVFDSLEY